METLYLQLAEMVQGRTRMLDRVLRFLDDAIWRLEQNPPRVLAGAKALKGWLEQES